MSAKSTLYYTSAAPIETLTELYGDRLDRLTDNDKLLLVSTIALWLVDDSGEYEMGEAASDVCLRQSPKVVSDDFWQSIAIVQEVSKEDALALVSALTEQLRAGVYA